MRAREFIQDLCEGPSQVLASEILQVSKYIAKWLAEYKPLRFYTVPQMFGKAENIPFKVTSPALQKMLSKDGAAFSTNPLLFKGRNPSSVAGYNAELNNIIISPDVLSSTDNVASYIAHEITHGIDNASWGGRVTMVPSSELTAAEYMAKPEEINARFTQALYDLAKSAGQLDMRDSPEVIERINAALVKNRLTPDVIGTGDLAQKKYDRLRSRAYQFMQQMEPLVEPGEPVPPSMFDRVRKMVTTFASFS